jgi:hypothetical protein
MDLGITGGVQVREPLRKWQNVEADSVIRFTGAAGADEPWPRPAAEITVEERLIGLDTRVRQWASNLSTMKRLEHGRADEPGRSYAGSRQGSIFRSTSNGNRASQVGPATDI